MDSVQVNKLLKILDVVFLHKILDVLYGTKMNDFAILLRSDVIWFY